LSPRQQQIVDAVAADSAELAVAEYLLEQRQTILRQLQSLPCCSRFVRYDRSTKDPVTIVEKWRRGVFFGGVIKYMND
jgi:hypothetical protein